tara:strand:- start:126 stop:359 length:234 start_codon:yes stop_codon:yes gene_type:complete
MKAIQVRYLQATETQGVRLKAFTDAGSLTEPRQYDLNADEQALALAERYIAKQAWAVDVVGFGSLSNGDYVATLGAN